MSNFPKVLESIENLSLEQIKNLLSLSSTLHSKNPNLAESPFAHCALTTIFFENSTRTKYSFIKAAWKLGIQAIDFPVSSSSLAKGEDFKENLETLHHQGFSHIVIRTSDPDFFCQFREGAKKESPIVLLNGGNGMVEHPTQALLDLYTFVRDFSDENGEENLENLKGKKICFVGDTLHSRVFHSHIKLAKMVGLEVSTSGPKEWSEGLVHHYDNFDEAIKECDILYMLRVQKERHAGKTDLNQLDDYVSQYGLTLHRLKKHHPNIEQAKVYHPGPVNIGIELSKDIMESKYYRGYHQVECSTNMRSAILALSIINNKNTQHNITKEEVHEWLK
jgi:aspartate carbamoyltransferase catalytic subunit